MFYGDGGTAKTTLSLDLAFHLVTGTDWLEYPVPRRFNVHVIENEGPRPLLRKKIRRKLAAWPHDAKPDGRLTVQAAPWAKFTFATPEWRAELARTIKDNEIDVLIVGPLTRVGMNSAGTLQEVVAFVGYVNALRGLLDRPLTVILIHHENKGGSVSGAWEGAGDTLFRCEKRGNGYSAIRIQKARWDSTSHDSGLELAWMPGEGFKRRDAADHFPVIFRLLSDDKPRTVKEIKEDVSAGDKAIRDILEERGDCFYLLSESQNVEGGRHKNAKLWRIKPGATGV